MLNETFFCDFQTPCWTLSFELSKPKSRFRFHWIRILILCEMRLDVARFARVSMLVFSSDKLKLGKWNGCDKKVFLCRKFWVLLLSWEVGSSSQQCCARHRSANVFRREESSRSLSSNQSNVDYRGGSVTDAFINVVLRPRLPSS